MNSAVVAVLCALAGITSAIIGDKSGVTFCADDQPDVKECRKNALQEVISMFPKGIPSIGLPPVDPMENLPPFSWKGSSHGINIKFQLTKPRITGHAGSIIDDLQVDVDKYRINIQTHAPGEYILEGIYRLEGHELGIPIKGNGTFKSVMVGSGADITYQGHPVKGKDGQRYLKLDTVDVEYTYGQSSYEFGGLFGDFPPLVAAGNLFINQVSRPVVEQVLLPALNKWMGEIYKPFAQDVFDKVPYDTLFPKTRTSKSESSDFSDFFSNWD